jgi:uncharacterized protein
MTTMKNIPETETSFFSRILWLLMFLMAGIMVTYLLFFACVAVLTAFNLAQLGNELARMGSNVVLMRLMQTIQSFCIFIVPPFLLCRQFKVKSSDFLQLGKPDLTSALLGIISIPVLIPLINGLVVWNGGLHLPESMQGMENWMRVHEDSAEKVTKIMLQGTTVLDLIINLVLIAGLAGLGEELFFRGLLQRIFIDGIKPRSENSPWNIPDWVVHVSIWMVAFLFSAIHLQFFGFFPRLLLGAWFGYLLWWTGSIWVPVLAHFTNNAISTLVAYTQNNGSLTENPDRLGLDQTWWLSVVSVLLLAGLVCLFEKNRKKRLLIETGGAKES